MLADGRTTRVVCCLALSFISELPTIRTEADADRVHGDSYRNSSLANASL